MKERKCSFAIKIQVFTTIFILLASAIVCEAQTQSKMFCFYPFNDKYAQKYTADSLQEWLKVFCSSLSNDDTMYDVVAGKGGGPNGAQWNPSSDLVIVLTNPQNQLPTQCKVYLNRKQNRSIVCHSLANDRSIIWFIIPKKTWEKQLRPIKKEDLTRLFASQSTDSLPSAETNDLLIGEILEISVQSLDKKLSASIFFHAAYGE